MLFRNYWISQVVQKH